MNSEKMGSLRKCLFVVVLCVQTCSATWNVKIVQLFLHLALGKLMQTSWQSERTPYEEAPIFLVMVRRHPKAGCNILILESTDCWSSVIQTCAAFGKVVHSSSCKGARLYCWLCRSRAVLCLQHCLKPHKVFHLLLSTVKTTLSVVNLTFTLQVFVSLFTWAAKVCLL